MSSPGVALSATILAEARELLSVLRRNRRFGYLLPFSSASQPIDHPLVKELKSLRDIIRVPVTVASPHHINHISSNPPLVPADALLNALEPFFEVVRSRDASGIITGVALQSLCRIAVRLIDSSRAANVLSQYANILSSIIDTAAACRFDATDPASDEVVLARITRVISVVCTSEAAPILSDASIIRAVEACLGIASGRRRASDLLKRTADTVLLDIFGALGQNVAAISAAHSVADDSIKFPSIFSFGVNGSAFGYAFDSDSFSQHGPMSLAVVVAVLQLAARMADPFYAQSSSERAIGLQLLSTIIGTAGSSLKSHPVLKRVLLRDCARGILRSLGLFKSQPSMIAYAFTLSIQLVHSLEEEAAPFLLALVERVFPYYISGYENALPNTDLAINATVLRETNGSNNANEIFVPSVAPNSLADVGVVPIDPVIREIGLETLADLLSIPGLLCVVYRLADCDMARADVAGPLLRTLGHASKLNGFRRRSKRLRASTSGTNRVSSPADVDSDDDDDIALDPTGNSEASRFGRSAALLCADSVLAVIDTISDRLKLETAGLINPPQMDEKALEMSQKIRKDKMRIQSAASSFNASEKVGKASKLLTMLREHNLVDSKNVADGTVKKDLEDDVRAIVRFIRETPGLSKEKIGNVLGEPDNLSRKVLADYTATFDFEDRQFTESLRVFLESFRLPGEAQKIDRIVQSFANRYFAQNNPRNDIARAKSTTDAGVPVSSKDVQNAESDVIGPMVSTSGPEVGVGAMNDMSQRSSVLKSADAAYVLSFSVVMLNTDQHNESIRKRMALDDFIKNCRGINDGEDLPKWFLSQVFDSIAAVEIRMSDEAGVGALTDVLWDEQLRRTNMSECQAPTCKDSRVFDEQVFLLAWEAGVIAANSILKEAGEPNSVQKALEGFLSVSRCATTFKVSEPTDAVTSSLCNATTIREGPLYGAVDRFGTDIKAQMASVALSGVSRECGDWLRSDGWQALVAYLLRLHALCLLPSDLEKRIGGFGSELVDVNKQLIQSSELIPAWWPSQVDGRDLSVEVTKPRKTARPNGFFAAILAASIGSEVGAVEDEDDDHMTRRSANGHVQQRASRTPPHYIRTRTRESTEARDLARKCIAGCRIEDVVINEAKVLQSASFQCLCKSVSKAAIRLLETDGRGDEQNPIEESEDGGSRGNAIIDWVEVLPSSPKNDSSIIAGVLTRDGQRVVPESESEFPSFSLSQSWDGALRNRDEQKAREFVTSFCVDVLCELTLQNRDRLSIPWPELHSLLVRIIAPSTQSLALLERAVVALLRIGVRLLHREELRNDVLRGLNLLVRLPTETNEALSIPVAAGVFNIVKGHGAIIESTPGWHAILSILENLARYKTQARELGLETIKWILKELTSSVAVSAQTYAPMLDAILAYTSCSSVEISIQALELLYHLSEHVVSFNSEKCAANEAVDEKRLEDEMWSEYWGPLFLGFATSVRDARGKVRNCALGAMERVIASRGSTELLTAGQWHQVLSSVILPLMTQLFATQGYLTATLEAEKEAQRKIMEERNAALGASGRNRGRSFLTSAEHDDRLVRSVIAACSRTRMRAVALTSKTFLLHHMAIATGLSEDSFTELWMSVLEVFRIAVENSVKGKENGEKRVADSDDVNEHVPESVKNMLLVMCDCGLLKREQPVRWNATFSLVREFIPDIEDAIFTATGASMPEARKQGASQAADVPERADKVTVDNDSESTEVRHLDDEGTAEERTMNKSESTTSVAVSS